MHPEEIKAALRMRGWTQATLAEELNISRSSVAHIISGRGRSDRIQQCISSILGKPISAIWPDQVTLRRSAQQLQAIRARRAAAGHVSQAACAA